MNGLEAGIASKVSTGREVLPRACGRQVALDFFQRRLVTDIELVHIDGSAGINDARVFVVLARGAWADHVISGVFALRARNIDVMRSIWISGATPAAVMAAMSASALRSLGRPSMSAST